MYAWVGGRERCDEEEGEDDDQAPIHTASLSEVKTSSCPAFGRACFPFHFSSRFPLPSLLAKIEDVPWLMYRLIAQVIFSYGYYYLLLLIITRTPTVRHQRPTSLGNFRLLAKLLMIQYSLM